MAQPPFNSHHNHTIHVSAHQYSLPPSSTPSATDDNAEPMFSIKANVNINFCSSDPTVERTIKGVSVWKSINLPSKTIGDMYDLIAQLHVPFPLDEVQWESRMIDGAPFRALLNDEDDLVETLADFFLEMESMLCNVDRRKLGVLLVIEKSVTLPADEFEAWTTLYDQVAMRESYETQLE